MGQAAVALIIVTGVGLLLAGIWALRLRTAVHPAYLALAALYACITSKGVQYPKDLIRELAIVLTLMPFAFVTAALPESARTRLPARPFAARRRES
jgi:hypothetical protein